MRKLTSLLLLISALSAGGCTQYQLTLTNEEHSLSPISPEKVQLFFAGEKVPPSKEIGYIVVKESSEKDGVAFLQEKAAALGADAIANLEVRIQTQTLLLVIIPIPVHSYFVSGTAISLTK